MTAALEMYAGGRRNGAQPRTAYWRHQIVVAHVADFWRHRRAGARYCQGDERHAAYVIGFIDGAIFGDAGADEVVEHWRLMGGAK